MVFALFHFLKHLRHCSHFFQWHPTPDKDGRRNKPAKEKTIKVIAFCVCMCVCSWFCVQKFNLMTKSMGFQLCAWNNQQLHIVVFIPFEWVNGNSVRTKIQTPSLDLQLECGAYEFWMIYIVAVVCSLPFVRTHHSIQLLACTSSTWNVKMLVNCPIVWDIVIWIINACTQYTVLLPRVFHSTNLHADKIGTQTYWFLFSNKLQQQQQQPS